MPISLVNFNCKLMYEICHCHVERQLSPTHASVYNATGQLQQNKILYMVEIGIG